MKLFHYILPIIAAAIAGAGFSACSDDDGPVSADTVSIIASSGNYFQYAAGNVTGTNSGIWTTDKVTFQP